MRDYDIESDLKQEKFQNIKLVQGDRGNKIKINVFEDGQPVKLTGCSITAKYKRADGEVVDGTVENKTDNYFYAVMNSNITKVAGTLKMLFSIEKDDVKVSTFLLLADVREGIGESSSTGGSSSGGGGEVTVDLSNYYKKNETYSKEQIDSQFKDIATKTIIENGKLYLVRENGTKIDTGTTLPSSGGSTGGNTPGGGSTGGNTPGGGTVNENVTYTRPIGFNWILNSGINISTGAITSSNQYLRSDYKVFPNGATITLGKYGDWKWTVNTYNKSTHAFQSNIVNTYETYTFKADGNVAYIFALWSGDTNFELIRNNYDAKITTIEQVTGGGQVVTSTDTIEMNWNDGRINTTTGALEDSSTFIRSNYISFDDGATIELGEYGDWYWFVNTYDKSTHAFKSCIINTKKKYTFKADGDVAYIFALWSGDTNFELIKNNYSAKITKTLIKANPSSGGSSSGGSSSGGSLWTAKLDLPDYMVAPIGDYIELFKYGMYYTNAPYMHNLFNIRIANIDGALTNFTEKIKVRCPSNLSAGSEIKGTTDLPLFQLLDVNGKVVDQKRVHIYAVNKNATFTNKTIAYIGDSLTAQKTRSSYTAKALANKGITLVGKTTGDTSDNKFTGIGGFTWWNYLENPSNLPGGRNENYLWDSSTGKVSLQKFYNEVNNGNPVDVMVILLGWNDLESGTFSKLGLGIDKVSKNARRFLDIVKEQSPNTKVILESYHYGYPGLIRGAYSDTMPQILHNKKISELNELYRAIANEYDNVYFLQNSPRIDVVHGMQLSQDTINRCTSETQTYCIDAVHPGDIGYHQYSDAEVDMILYALSK